MMPDRCPDCPLVGCRRLGKTDIRGRSLCDLYLAAKATTPTPVSAAQPRATVNVWAPILLARECDYRLRLDPEEREGCGCDAVCLRGMGDSRQRVSIGECVRCVQGEFNGHG